nr:CFA/I fimbrial chaperone [Raoultella sp. NCTC 9187]
MLTNTIRLMAWLMALCLPTVGEAISVGNLTFSLGAEESFAAKRVLNNNKSARLYQVSVVGIDRPGGKEVRSRPADGELLFAPRPADPAGGGGGIF